MAVQRSRTRDFVSRRKHEKQHFTGLTRDGSGAGPSPPQKTNIGFSGDPGVRARLAGSATHSVGMGPSKGEGVQQNSRARVSDALFRTENPELAQGPGKIWSSGLGGKRESPADLLPGLALADLLYWL